MDGDAEKVFQVTTPLAAPALRLLNQWLIIVTPLVPVVLLEVMCIEEASMKAWLDIIF